MAGSAIFWTTDGYGPEKAGAAAFCASMSTRPIPPPTLRERRHRGLARRRVAGSWPSTSGSVSRPSGTRREGARSIVDPRTEIPSTKECLRRGGLSNPAPAILYRRRGSFLIPVAALRERRRLIAIIVGRSDMWRGQGFRQSHAVRYVRHGQRFPSRKARFRTFSSRSSMGLYREASKSPGDLIMKKLTLLGVIVGAALLSATPFSLHTSQKSVVLSLDRAEARVGRPLTATSVAGVHRRAHRRAYRHGHYYYY
jgi:hypothetical protein